MIVFFTTVLVLLCLLVILLIMIQRTSGGMGSALGGGAADQVLGAGSAAHLSKFTVYGILGFFILSFVLYAFYQSEAESSQQVLRQGSAPALESAPADAGGRPSSAENPETPAPSQPDSQSPDTAPPAESPKVDINASE